MIQNMPIEQFTYAGTKNPAWDYFHSHGKLRTITNGFICHICQILPSMRIKNALYRLIGVKLGKHVVIAAYVIIDPYFPELITIEDNVIIGVGSSILTHEYSQQGLRKGPVHIKHHALIGGMSMIRSGVTIGEHAVVAAHSLVNKNVEGYTTVGGVPAKLLKIQTKEKDIKSKYKITNQI